MAVKVGINGFGRIGRVVFRSCLQNPNLTISAINDPAINAEYVCYLIKFDSTHGKYKGKVNYVDNEIIIDGHHVQLFHNKLPVDIPWHTLGVEYVVEASGMFTSYEKASGHLQSQSVKRVIVTSPSVDVPMIIHGVNDNRLKTGHKVLSCASSTLYCLAPIIKILEDNFGVAEGFVTSIHALTPSLKPLDGLCLRGKHWRDHRSIHQNIIPASTGACKALGKIIPSVRDKLTGLAFRVPVVNVSVLDLTIRLNTNTTLTDIVKAVENVSKTSMKTVIKLSSDQAVSSDFIGDSHSCILDVDLSMGLKPDFYKIVCWYENEYSYGCRIIDSIFFSENQFSQQSLSVNTISIKSCRRTLQRGGSDCLLSHCSCDDDLGMNNVTSNPSQDTKPKTKIPRPNFIKRRISRTLQAITPLTSDKAKKDNEILKIWKAGDEHTVSKPRQKKNLVFQSYAVLKPPSKEKTECIKAQQRLENVKKEFSKMVSITENLLKMSCSSKFKFSSLATVSKENVDFNTTEEIVPSSLHCNYSHINTNEKSEDDAGDGNEKLTAHGDIIETVGIVDVIVKKNSNQEVIRYDNFRDRTDNLSGSFINQNIIKKHEENNTVESSLEIIEVIDSSYDFNEQVTKTVNILLKGLSESIINKEENDELTFMNMEVNSQEKSDDEELVLKIINDDIEKPPVQINVVTQASVCNNLQLSENSNNTGEQIEKYDMKDLVNYIRTKDYNVLVIDEELKKRNIILVNNKKNDMDSEHFKLSDVDAGRKSDNIIIVHDQNMTSTKNIPEKLVQKQLNSPDILPQNISPDTKIAKCDNKQDLFDKLDSSSGTDSESSFEVNKKKSQILQIADLYSNSIEDLTRLDKICRIIEISDELSDQLFSVLDNSVKSESNKWSFKDLCEKIKLDEFCNRVFGK